MDLPPDFRHLFSKFAASSVDYLMIGGWAVSFHSEPRYTKDLDLLLVGSDDNLARAAEALGAFGAPRSVIDLLLALGPEEFSSLVAVAGQTLERVPAAHASPSRIPRDLRKRRAVLVAKRGPLLRGREREGDGLLCGGSHD
ncbi:MAG: hypothetical protein IPQ09_08450 [Myxococcales bacterium]|nr:hypothetical protein [Myxococcales bacterium]